MSPSQRLTTSIPDGSDQHGEAGSSSLVLDRYRIGRRLGSGAFGTVYEARDERLDRIVAVKVIPRELVATARFEREARAAARLSHPAIVTLYEAAIDDDGAYLVSEIVRGRTLQRLLADGACSDRQILQIGAALCDALQHAHREGVIHRDVKPSNVLVPRHPTGLADAAKLTDFGVAQLPGAESLTVGGAVLGTAAYMSPEQAAGRDVSSQSDLYSLTLMIYEALSGVNPLAEALRSGRSHPFVPPLRRQRRNLGRGLCAAIDQALLAKPSSRGTLGELRLALLAALPDADEAPGMVAPAPSPRELAMTLIGGPSERETMVEQPELAAARPGPTRRPRRRPAPHAAPAAPEWLPRASNALAAGLAAGWLSEHLLTSPPLAPLTAGLIAFACCLLAPRLGWLAVIGALVGFAVDQGHGAGALVLAAVTLVPSLALLFTRQGAALPALAPALGVFGVGGAWPALASFTGRSWWQRAVVGAFGYIWMVLAGALIGHDLYWQPLPARAISGWPTDLSTSWHGVIVGLASSPGLAGALVWAAIAAVLPLTRGGRWPTFELFVAVLAAVVSVIALGAVGAQHLHDSIAGAIAAAIIAGAPAIWALMHRHGNQFEPTATVSYDQ